MRRTKSTNVLEAMKPLTEDKEQVVTHLPIKKTKSTNDLEMIKPGTEDKIQVVTNLPMRRTKSRKAWRSLLKTKCK